MSSSKAGRARSESGFTLIDMLFVIALIGLLSTLAIPGLMRARGAAQSASALGTMKVVNSAQLSFAITCGLGFYSPDFQTLGVSRRRRSTRSCRRRCRRVRRSSRAATPSAWRESAFPAPRRPVTGSRPAGIIWLRPRRGSARHRRRGARYFGTNADGTIYEDAASYLSTMPETGAPPGGAPIK